MKPGSFRKLERPTDKSSKAVDSCSFFVLIFCEEEQMSAALSELLLLSLTATGAWIAAIFAVLTLRKGRASTNDLTKDGAAAILRSETEIIRTAVQDQARWLRQELGESLSRFQEMTLTTLGTLRDGIDSQVRVFGERLDGGITAIDNRAAAISTKLNDDMAQMRAEANANREHLRAAVDQKLDHSVRQQADASKQLRDELSGNFHRLGGRVADSLSESSQIQKERLENVTLALSGLAEKLEKAQHGLRTALEIGLDKMRGDNAEKLEQIRVTVDEKLQG
ncbi:MAG: hypothetical protein WBD95_05865, partial [Xanthobacteraceae bacterium]